MRLTRAIVAAALLSLTLPATASGEVLRFEVTQSLTEFAKAKAGTDNKSVKKGVRTVGLGNRAFFLQESGTDKLIYDFNTRKIHRVDTKANTYTESSLYANVAFRRAEFDNRMRLRQILQRMAPTSQQYDPVQLACLFGLVPPTDKSFALLKRSTQGTTTTYTYKGKPLSSYKLSSQKLSPSMVPILSQYYMYSLNLHPTVRLGLVKSGYYAGDLSYTLENPPVLEEKEAHKLLKVESISADCTTGSAHRVIRPENPLKAVLERSQQLGGKPSANFREDSMVFCTRALQEKRLVDAMLGAFEYVIQTGESLPGIVDSVKKQLKDDKNAQKLKRAMGSPSSVAEAKTYLADLNSLNLKGSKVAYLLDLFRANLSSYIQTENPKEPVQDPQKLFLKVLTVNPFLTGAYKDLGIYFFNRYKMVEAWECWDTARSFYPRQPMLSTVTEIEERLQIEVPEFFNGDKP